MEYSWAVPGAKVVCVDAYIPIIQGETPENFGPQPMVGEICVISCLDEMTDGGLGVILQGFADDEIYGIEHFRPLITRTESEDVAMFLKIADEAGERIDA